MFRALTLVPGQPSFCMAEQLKAWGGEEIEVQILLFLSLSLSLFFFFGCAGSSLWHKGLVALQHVGS